MEPPAPGMSDAAGHPVAGISSLQLARQQSDHICQLPGGRQPASNLRRTLPVMRETLLS